LDSTAQQRTASRQSRALIASIAHLVEIKVDSYEFGDKIGKDFDPAVAFTGTPALWGATVTPSSFAFLPGEAYRDVTFKSEARRTPRVHRVISIECLARRCPSGGVTLTVTTGG